MSQIKNLRKIGLYMIDDFQMNTPAGKYFNDPRYTMSDIDMTCSLLRKQLRKGYMVEYLFPRSVRGQAFDLLLNKLKRVCEKMKIVQERWKNENE